MSRAELGESGSDDLGVFARIGLPAKAWGWNLVDMVEEARWRWQSGREGDLVREWNSKGFVERKRSIWFWVSIGVLDSTQ